MDDNELRILKLEEKVAFLQRALVSLNQVNLYTISALLKVHGFDDFKIRIDRLFEEAKDITEEVARELRK